MKSFFVASAPVALASLFLALPAAAQDEAATPTAPPASASASASASAGAAEARSRRSAIALERVGGIGYAKAAANTGNDSLSLVALGVGGVTPNPFAVRASASTSSCRRTSRWAARSASPPLGLDELGQHEPGRRLGVPLHAHAAHRLPHPAERQGRPHASRRLTFAGASASPSNSSNDASILRIAIGADAPVAFRLTDSFNLLVGVGIDYTVSATVSTTSTSTTTTGGTTAAPPPRARRPTT